MQTPNERAGFTMIEMLIVVAMIAILGLIAVPALKDLTLRRQVKEAMALGFVAERGVQAAWSASGKMPANNAEAGLPEPQKIIGNLVSEVTVDQGAVTITFGNNAAKSLEGKRLTRRPAVVPDARVVPIAWICNEVAVPNGMTVVGANLTDVPMSWLPAECRSAEAK